MQNLGHKMRQNSHWKCLKPKTVIWPFYWTQVLLQYGRVMKKGWWSGYKAQVLSSLVWLTKKLGNWTLSVGAMCLKEPCSLRSGFLRSNFWLIRKSRFEHLVLVGFLAPNIYGISPFSAEFLHVISSFVLCHSSILLYNGQQQIVNITRHIAGVAEKKNMLLVKPS